MNSAFGTIVLITWAGIARAGGLDLPPDQRAAFGAEVRATLLAHPDIVVRALNGDTGYAAAAQADRDLLADQGALFAPTPLGIGADAPRLTILFYEDYPCADCASAWAELVALAQRHPDIRIEPRFARDSGTAQLLLSLLDRQGAGAYHAARAQLMAARDAAGLAQIIAAQGWVQDRMFRKAPGTEAAAFDRMQLDMAPAYVLPDMMLRGALPGFVLEKYIRP